MYYATDSSYNYDADHIIDYFDTDGEESHLKHWSSGNNGSNGWSKYDHDNENHGHGEWWSDGSGSGKSGKSKSGKGSGDSSNDEWWSGSGKSGKSKSGKGSGKSRKLLSRKFRR